MAVAAAALRIGSMLAKTGGAIAKGGKFAMKKGGTVLKKSKKIAGNVKKSVKKGAKISKERFMRGVDYIKKERERKKREAEERALEQANKSKEKPSAKKSAARGGGFLEKIISFISTILIGWVVTNLPKIIETVKGVIKKIKEIYNNITGFFSSIGEFFTGIKESIGNTLNKIKDIDFSKVGEKIKEKITGLKDAFTNMIANIGKGLGILKSKKNEDPSKLAKSGFGGDASQVNNQSSKKVDDANSDINTLKKDTNKLMSDTNKLGDNFNKSIKKAESEMSKVNLNVSVNQINEVGKNQELKTIDKDGGSSDNSSQQLNRKESKSTVLTTMKSVSKDTNKFISNTAKPDIAKSITKIKKPKNIVVDNIIPSQMSPQNQEGGKTKVIVLGKSLNSMVKENILLDAVYT